GAFDAQRARGGGAGGEGDRPVDGDGDGRAGALRGAEFVALDGGERGVFEVGQIEARAIDAARLHAAVGADDQAAHDGRRDGDVGARRHRGGALDEQRQHVAGGVELAGVEDGGGAALAVGGSAGRVHGRGQRRAPRRRVAAPAEERGGDGEERAGEQPQRARRTATR